MKCLLSQTAVTNLLKMIQTFKSLYTTDDEEEKHTIYMQTVLCRCLYVQHSLSHSLAHMHADTQTPLPVCVMLCLWF